MPTRISTDDIAMRERPSYWNFLVSSVLGRLNTIPQRDGAFSGSIAYSHLSSIPVAQVASSQLRVLRPEKFISDPHEDFYKVNFQLKGQATLSQHGRSASLEPGKWVIYDNTRPYELNFHTDYRQLLFLVPRAQLLNRFPTIDLRLGQALSCQSGMGRVLFNFVANVLDEGDRFSAESQTHTAQMLLDMLLLGITEAATTPVQLPASSRYIQLRQFILANLHRGDLSAETLANHLHLSKRYIQKLFADRDTTVNQTIWQERIKRCEHDLANPQLANTPAQEIAYAWGFNSSAHFSRLFKQSTGLTPSAYRKQALGALSQ